MRCAAKRTSPRLSRLNIEVGGGFSLSGPYLPATALAHCTPEHAPSPTLTPSAEIASALQCGRGQAGRPSGRLRLRSKSGGNFRHFLHDLAAIYAPSTHVRVRARGTRIFTTPGPSRAVGRHGIISLFSACSSGCGGLWNPRGGEHRKNTAAGMRGQDRLIARYARGGILITTGRQHRKSNEPGTESHSQYAH